MKISVVMPNRNGERFLEEAIRSVLRERELGVDLEYILADGGSTDGSMDIVGAYRDRIDVLLTEPDDGPADAINRGLSKATGDIVCWLNADDRYCPGALKRVIQTMSDNPGRALSFGHCRIIDEAGAETRSGITWFKECFYPLSGRFTIQCINYISQPAMFFRRAAFGEAGPLRLDLKAAWDYDLILRLWAQGGAVRIDPPALADFRWHATSISAQHFKRQFREEFEVAAGDAGRFSLQSFLHLGVRYGIVAIYSFMAARRRLRT